MTVSQSYPCAETGPSPSSPDLCATCGEPNIYALSCRRGLCPNDPASPNYRPAIERTETGR